ncbi:MAG: hypothetical protein HY866_02950 [Chloroflexi bacterium]|nr:hypothetical protein [Chloroflexota bacterium]
MNISKKTLALIFSIVIIIITLAALASPALALNGDTKPTKTPKPPSEDHGNGPKDSPGNGAGGDNAQLPPEETSETGGSDTQQQGTPVAGAPSSGGVTPILIEGNASCGALGYGDSEFKIEPPNGGTYTVNGSDTVTVSTNGAYFDWTSTIGIAAVFVKGGPVGNLYAYSPESFGDGSLHSPINPNTGEPYGLSHISFCYNTAMQYALTVTKDAYTTFTRAHEWSIAKSASPNVWSLAGGESGTTVYTVSVTHLTSYNSDWAVSGNIWITNPSPSDVTLTGVIDDVAGVPASVNCPSMTVPGGGTLVCTYYAALPDGTNRTNTVTVTTAGPVGGGSATASMIFGAPTTSINGTIDVQDSNGGFWTFSDSGSVSYDRTFSCPADQGTHENIATILQTNQSADAAVNVECTTDIVRKDAVTSFTRAYQWGILKSVAPDTWNLFRGDSGTSTYTISLTRTGYEDSGWAVSGHIWITNPNSVPAELTEVMDLISPDIVAAVDCGIDLPYLLAPGETLTCTYNTPLPDGSSRTNTATVTLDGGTYSTTVDVIFGGPTSEVNGTVEVDDSNGLSWTFSDSGSVSYDRTFTCDGDQGSHGNEAVIAQTGQASDALVNVNCFALDVVKDTSTSTERRWHWLIDKTGDQTALTLPVGDQSLVNYQVVVNAAPQDNIWTVSGTIWVANSTPLPALLNGVSDVVSGGFPAAVNCGVDFPYLLAPGETLICTYNATLPDSTERVNTATATLQNTPGGTTDFSGSATVDFSDALPNEVDECVIVSDDRLGSLGIVCAEDIPQTFSYTLPVGPYDVCGSYSFANTASFVTNDTGTSGSDTWTVGVTVPCGGQGCTSTPGYWKNHSQYGPARYDDTWALIGEDTPFFLSGQSWFQVLSTPSADGNAYYILARAYIAAYLNVLAGADASAVAAQITHAEELFAIYTPTDSLSGAVRADFISTANTLDQYNNGLIGPGHCEG